MLANDSNCEVATTKSCTANNKKMAKKKAWRCAMWDLWRTSRSGRNRVPGTLRSTRPVWQVQKFHLLKVCIADAPNYFRQKEVQARSGVLGVRGGRCTSLTSGACLILRLSIVCYDKKGYTIGGYQQETPDDPCELIFIIFHTMRSLSVAGSHKKSDGYP